MTTHNADHTQRRPAGVACLKVGVGELGAGGLLGSMSAGVGVDRSGFITAIISCNLHQN